MKMHLYGGYFLKKIILFIVVLFCAAMVNGVMAQNNALVSKLTVLKEDSGNLSEMILLPYTAFQDFGEVNGLSEAKRSSLRLRKPVGR